MEHRRAFPRNRTMGRNPIIAKPPAFVTQAPANRVHQKIPRDVLESQLFSNPSQLESRGENLRKTAIVGAIQKMSLDQCFLFFRTLEHVGYQGDILIFSSGIDDREKSLLGLHGNCRFIDVSDNAMNINSLRFYAYHRYLDCMDYDHILLADVRDIVFQRDPFDFEKKDTIYASLEDKDTLDSCSINKNWILKCYPNDVCRKMAHCRVSCAGTIVGTGVRIKKHIENICNELDKIDQRVLNESGPDQVVHNFLVYQGDEKFDYIDNNTGPIVTLAKTCEGDIKYNSDGLMVNTSGVVNIVHQYDRHIFLNGYVQKLIEGLRKCQ